MSNHRLNCPCCTVKSFPSYKFGLPTYFWTVRFLFLLLQSPSTLLFRFQNLVLFQLHKFLEIPRIKRPSYHSLYLLPYCDHIAISVTSLVRPRISGTIREPKTKPIDNDSLSSVVSNSRILLLLNNKKVLRYLTNPPRKQS